MNSHLENNAVVAVIEFGWLDVQLEELKESGDCPKLVTAVEEATKNHRADLQLLIVSAVDMVWMGAGEAPELEGRLVDWKPAFLLVHSPHGHRFAAMWLDPAIEHLPHAAAALALCVIVSEGDCGSEVTADDFFFIAGAIARRRGVVGDV